MARKTGAYTYRPVDPEEERILSFSDESNAADERYIYGAEAPERVERPAPRRADVRRMPRRAAAGRIRATAFGWGYVILVAAAATFLLLACISLLSVHSDITSSQRSIQKAEEQLQKLRAENNAKEIYLNKSIDLNEVYRIATEELGMVYPSADQVIYYDRSDGGYVRQYEDIPNT